MNIYKQKDNIIIRPMLKSDVKKIIDALTEQGFYADQLKFEKYLDMQENNMRLIFVASENDLVLGYVTLDQNPSYGPWKNQNIPMVIDLNVFKVYQNQGIGSMLMDTVEEYAFHDANSITLGVGLHEGYGQAQKLYIKRGYIPDGSGVWYHDQVAKAYQTCENDDDLNLYLIKKKNY